MCSRRISLLRGAPILALVILLAALANRAPAAAQSTNATAAPGGVAPQSQVTENPAPAQTEAWSEAAGALAAKIMEHTPPGNPLALAVKNLSSLGDDDVAQVRRALRNQLRSLKARLTGTKQAKAEVEVTLSENTEGYLWIAEIRPHPPPNAPPDNAANAVVMVAVPRPGGDDIRAFAEPLSIRKTRLYQQTEPILDVALLENPPVATATPPVSALGAARLLVLGLDGVALYERAETPQSGSRSGWTWRRKESAPLTRPRPWPRDPRGRLLVRPDNGFDVFLPGGKCSGALQPALTLECHEGDEPWPLVAATGEGNLASATAVAPAAYFTPDRNFFDGRVKLDGDHEMKAPPFLSIVALPLGAAFHAGLPAPPARVAPATAGAPGWVISGLDGRAQLLNSVAGEVANVGGWGSEIAGLQSGCGSGWQVLASQARDLNETDTLQAYEIVNRKPVPVSTSVEFSGPITELWPLAGGSEAMAIVRNLQTESYEAFRLSISCGQ